jgi:hypothetical protein
MSFIPEVSLGENSRISIGSTQLLVQSGTVRDNPPPIQTGDNLTGGYTTKTRGNRNLDISAKCQWTVAENPFSNPPSVTPGSTIIDVIVTPDVNDPTSFYSLPFCWVNSATCNIDSGGTGGVISYDLDLTNQGVYATPNNPQP